MTSGAPRVAITVPTFRRPARLGALLAALDEQRAGTDGVHVIVIDNDPDQSARAVCDGRGVAYVAEPRRGLTAVRNRAIDEAVAHGAEALIFIDDDEIPEPGWLCALIEPWRAGRADLVSGRVRSVFDPEPDPWIIAGGFFRRVTFADGEQVSAAATNNLLIDLTFVQRTGVRFDDRFSTTGGEDIHFTTAASRQGARIVVANAACVLDPVPAERATRDWVLRRAYRVGTTTARVDISFVPGRALARRARWVALGLARAAAGAARWALGAVTCSVTHRARGARLIARGAGMAAGGIGVRYHEYRRPIGDPRT